MLLNITVNNKKIKMLVEPDEYLIDTLRKAGYLSVKRGCDTGTCGLCTVFVEGKPVLSCSTLSLRVNNKKKETLEGHQEIAKRFAVFMGLEGADQCGFCAPGFTMTVIGLKNEFLSNGRVPTDEEILHYLNGTLCRCTGYASQLRAIKNFLEAEKNENS